MGAVRQITERDYAILKYLSYGPSNLYSIGRKFFQRKSDAESPMGVDKKKRDFSKYAWKRIASLKQDGLIQYKKFAREQSPIVVLTKLGAQEVALKFGLEIENIRYHFPKAEELRHDLMVASTIRKMVEESEVHNLYKVEYIHTEYFARKVSGRQKKRGIFFPDFRVRVVPYKGPAITLDVEIDSGSMGRSVVYNKISSFKNHVLIIAPNSERIKKLVHYLETDSARKQGTLPPVYFVLWQHFLTNGCRFSRVFNLQTGSQGVLPIVIS